MLPHAIRADQRSGDAIINLFSSGPSRTPVPTGHDARYNKFKQIPSAQRTAHCVTVCQREEKR